MEVQALLFPQKRCHGWAAGGRGSVSPSTHSFYQRQYSHEQNGETGAKHSMLKYIPSGLGKAD